MATAELRPSSDRCRLRLLQRQATYGVGREVAQELGNGDPEGTAEPQHDREARDLRAAFEIARVGGGDPGRFRELFLRPAGSRPELAHALSKDLCLGCHVGLIINNR